MPSISLKGILSRIVSHFDAKHFEAYLMKVSRTPAQLTGDVNSLCGKLSMTPPTAAEIQECHDGLICLLVFIQKFTQFGTDEEKRKMQGAISNLVKTGNLPYTLKSIFQSKFAESLGSRTVNTLTYRANTTDRMEPVLGGIYTALSTANDVTLTPDEQQLMYALLFVRRLDNFM